MPSLTALSPAKQPPSRATRNNALPRCAMRRYALNECQQPALLYFLSFNISGLRSWNTACYYQPVINWEPVHGSVEIR
jgi:hypothetical protein